MRRPWPAPLVNPDEPEPELISKLFLTLRLVPVLSRRLRRQRIATNITVLH